MTKRCELGEQREGVCLVVGKGEDEIIESKECNKNNKMMKEEAWQWVLENFQAKFGEGKRSLKNLKGVWKRMKLTAKAEYHVVNKLKAAGGPPPPPQPSAISAIMKQICPQEFIQIRNTNTYPQLTWWYWPDIGFILARNGYYRTRHPCTTPILARRYVAHCRIAIIGPIPGQP